MALFTTYLSAIKKLDQDIVNRALIYYVMRNRGNNEVAPTKALLFAIKSKNISWDQYAKDYVNQIQKNRQAVTWIDKIAEQSLFNDVILVCFEKDHTHCHRTLLANQIKFRHPEINYVGDLKPLIVGE